MGAAFQTSSFLRVYVYVVCFVSIDIIFKQHTQVVVSAYACIAGAFSKREEEKEIPKRRVSTDLKKAALLKQNTV